MNTILLNQIQSTLLSLYNDSKNDRLKMMKGVMKGILSPLKPIDFKDVYLSISKQQGEELVELIITLNLKNIVEFGTSFGISTLYLAKGALNTGGQIITTELIDSKAKTAMRNFQKAGVSELIEVRIGDALETLKDHQTPIDLLLLDGWKNLYLPIFQLLKSNFHTNTVIYVDNADMNDTKLFLREVSKNPHYTIEYKFGGKVALISAEIEK